MFWYFLVSFAVTVILNEYLRPKPKLENARPASLGDFQFPTATEGRVVPIIFGTNELRGPNVVWYGDLRQDAIQQSVKTGLWSKKKVISGFTYYVGIQMALCRGPDVELVRVRISERDAFVGTVSGETTFDIEQRDFFGGTENGQGGILATCDFFPGSASQTVSPYLDNASRQKVTSAATQTAPAYNGTCYVVAREFGVSAASARGAYIGTSTSVAPWFFEVRRFSALMPGQTAGHHIIGGTDCNPANVVYEALTNTEWGEGHPAADIDTASFIAAGETLRNEANGFSFIMDRTMEAIDFIREVERQIDGFVYEDKRTGKWVISLARDDYDIDLVPQLTDDNCEATSYNRGSWEDTTNQITVQFSKRGDNYKESYAVAQDMANMLIRGAGTVTTGSFVVAQTSYPGCKDPALAANLSWRDLRAQSTPLARVNVSCNRSVQGIHIGGVVAWTSSQFGFTKLPLRITAINWGTLTDDHVELSCVQDVFKFAAASYGSPPDTGWTPPGVTLAAYASNRQLAFESPRALVVKDPDFGGDDTIAKVQCAARRQGSEVAFQITQRNDPTTPSGSYADSGSCYSFMRIGKLLSTLDAATAIPTTTITIVPDPDTQAEIVGLLSDVVTAGDMGIDLVHLIMVGSEFMLVTSAANNAGNVDLQTVYRGVLDSAQESHAANDAVYLIFSGAGITEASFPLTQHVDIELRAQSDVETYAGSVTAISLVMDKRTIRPYPVSAIFSHGSSTPFNTPALEGDSGATENDYGFNLRWRRRRFNNTDEVAELLADQAVDASTEFRVKVWVDPTGANVLVHTSSWQTGIGPEFIPRNEIINAAAAGTAVKIQVETRHDILAEIDLVGRYAQAETRTPTSGLSTLFYFGGNLTAGTPSNLYTAAATGTFTLRIGQAFSTSDVQVSVNGGAYSTVIAASATSGTFALTSGDTVRVKQTTSNTPTLNFLSLDNPSAVRVAYGVLHN